MSFFIGRNERIRTSDFYVPNVAFYQAELHSDIFNTAIDSIFFLTIKQNFQKNAKNFFPFYDQRNKKSRALLERCFFAKERLIPNTFCVEIGIWLIFQCHVCNNTASGILITSFEALSDRNHIAGLQRIDVHLRFRTFQR